MQFKCPECRQQLRLAHQMADRVVRCPTCGALFRMGESGADLSPSVALPVSLPVSSSASRHSQPEPPRRTNPRQPSLKQLFLAVDVSTSVRRHLQMMHWHLTESLRQIRDNGPFELAVYLFHRHVMPFPSGQLCFPRPYEQAHIPSLEELQQRVGGGTAILDTLDSLITDAQQSECADRRVILLTDGWERSSKRTNESDLRAKIQAVSSQIDIALTGFVDSRSHDCLVDLAERLQLPSGAWAFAQHVGTEQSISDSIHDMSLELVKFAVLSSHSTNLTPPTARTRQRPPLADRVDNGDLPSEYGFPQGWSNPQSSLSGSGIQTGSRA